MNREKEKKILIYSKTATVNNWLQHALLYSSHKPKLTQANAMKKYINNTNLHFLSSYSFIVLERRTLFAHYYFSSP